MAETPNLFDVLNREIAQLSLQRDQLLATYHRTLGKIEAHEQTKATLVSMAEAAAVPDTPPSKRTPRVDAPRTGPAKAKTKKAG